ncbi:hypothetical protein [Knoellia sp. LjRoot47]|uniref:hypothetical protein n=1 Tax=Knoellia sp. LjRoot47 TaxID=3342330 RepID=UPI003F4FED5C
MTASQAAVDRGETNSRLEAQIALLPTATARDYKNVGTREAFERRRLDHPQPLMEIVVHGLTRPTD